MASWVRGPRDREGTESDDGADDELAPGRRTLTANLRRPIDAPTAPGRRALTDHIRGHGASGNAHPDAKHWREKFGIEIDEHGNAYDSAAPDESTNARQDAAQQGHDTSTPGREQLAALFPDRSGPRSQPPAVVRALATSRGSPLPDPEYWTSRVGADVSHAELVTDDTAAAAAAALKVRAFTVGNRVFFGTGNSAATDDGDLLAHELTHVAQQHGAPTPESWGSLPRLDHDDAREVAAREHDGPGGRSALAIAADPGTDAKKKKAGDDAPDLPAAEPFRWIQGTYSLWMRADWFRRAKDFYIDGGQWVSPTSTGALLGELAAKGMLSWVTPDVIRKVAGQIGVKPKPGKVFAVRLDVDVFSLIGLPPGPSALVGFRDDQGLVLTIPILDVAGDIGKQFPLSRAHKEQIIAAVEGFTHLKVRADQKKEFLDAKIQGELGRAAASFNLYRKSCDQWFGADAYKAFLEKPADDSKKDLGFGAPGGAQTISDLTPSEIDYVQKWLKAHIREEKDTGQPVVMSRLLYESLKKIDGLPEKEQKKALEILKGDPNPKDPKQQKAPELTQLTAELVERVIVQAKFEIDREAAGFDPLKHNGTERPPVFDWEIPAKLDQRSGLIVDGETVTFNIEIDWPPPYTLDQDSEYRWRPMVADVDWFFERHHDDLGFEHLGGGRQHTVSSGSHAGTSFTFKLDPGEQSGIWTVHAYVRHNFFQPKHLTTKVEVKPEAMRLADLRKETYAGLGTHKIAEDDHHFDTTWFNKTFGKHDYDHGLKFTGELPKDFARRTPAERVQSLDNEIAQQEKLLAYLRKTNEHPDAIDASTHYLAKLRDAKESMAGDVKNNWKPFEIRGFYLGTGNAYFDGALDIYGTYRQVWGVLAGEGQGAGAPPTEGVTGIEVQLRDLSRGSRRRTTRSTAAVEPSKPPSRMRSSTSARSTRRARSRCSRRASTRPRTRRPARPSGSSSRRVRHGRTSRRRCGTPSSTRSSTSAPRS